MAKYNSINDVIKGHIDAIIEAQGVDEADYACGNDINGHLAALTKLYGDMTGETPDPMTDSFCITSALDSLLNITDEATGCTTPNPLKALTVDADIQVSTDLLGKYVTDLQDDVEIEDGVISGTLNYVEGYTGFSGLAAEQSGYYLALHAEVPEVTGTTIKFKGKQESTLDADGIIVIRVTDVNKPISFSASKSGNLTVTKKLSLKGLTLAPNEEE